MFFSSFVTLALAALPALAAPAINARQGQYQVYSDGTKGTVEGQASDFSADFHTSAFLSRGGCSSTASIQWCTTAQLSADPTKNLETSDYAPYVTGGIGTNQRAILASERYINATSVVTHKLRFHISTAYTAVPVGSDNAVTLVALRNFDPSVGLKQLDIKAQTFTGSETSGTGIYVNVVHQDGSDDFPSLFPLANAVGKTIEVTYELAPKGLTVGTDGVFTARVSAKFVTTGQQLFSVEVTKTALPDGPIAEKTAHKLIFGANRKASAGQQDLKIWFGDYTVDPPAPFHPDRV
ncbi:hypothetical protein BKA62DRAFT_659269 [Auriculariales sp. MPI-PUGE-AT-0066]|nr:hypothetical protein BKA62DRAFT_659269 [Auriculariales sp. MPI-PUGE-AT-0066]